MRDFFYVLTQTFAGACLGAAIGGLAALNVCLYIANSVFA